MIRRILCLYAILVYGLLEARLYFVHVPKTGGTTLRCLLEMQLGIDEIYPYRSQKKTKGYVNHALVSGHLPYWLCTQLDPDFAEAFKVTILRDPIDRYLSFLRAKKRRCDLHPTLESVMDERFSAKNPYKLGLIDNAMCRFFADCPNLEGEELLRSAKKGLEQFDYVLFFDNFSQDVVDLFRCFNIPLDERDIPQLNATYKEPVNPQLLEEIRKENLWDLELYRYAKENIRKKEVAYCLRGPSFEEVLAPSTQIDYHFDFPLLGKGWSYRENLKDESLSFPVCRWVLDQPASIYFPLYEEKEYELSFSARLYTEDLSIRVTVNGHEVELQRETEGQFSSYSGKIRKDWVQGALVEVTFHPQKILSYADSSHSQHLLVSFAVHRIQIY